MMRFVRGGSLLTPRLWWNPIPLSTSLRLFSSPTTAAVKGMNDCRGRGLCYTSPVHHYRDAYNRTPSLNILQRIERPGCLRPFSSSTTTTQEHQKDDEELPPDDSDEWVTIDKLTGRPEEDLLDDLDTEVNADLEELHHHHHPSDQGDVSDQGWRRKKRDNNRSGSAVVTAVDIEDGDEARTGELGAHDDDDIDIDSGKQWTTDGSNFSKRRKVNKNKIPPRPKVCEDDIEEKFLRGSGPGGQKINKTSSAVQLRHIPTGIVVKSQATRSRSQNRKIARTILAEKLEVMEKGPESRIELKRELKRRRKADRSKKSRRKYRALEEEKMKVKTGVDGDGDGDGGEGKDLGSNA